MTGVDGEGYRLISKPGHPMARKSGVALEHRVVLFDYLGPGPHPCHWCGKKLQWQSSRASGICVDHLDDDRLNNVLANLVPACVGCNSRRGTRRVVASAIVPSFMEAVAARVVAAGPAVDVVEAAVTATMAELSVALKERRFGRATLNSLELTLMADLLVQAAKAKAA